jgi:formate hydrogenlyase transcriptional activator
MEVTLGPLKSDQGTAVATAIRDGNDFDRVRELQSLLDFQRMVAKLSRIFISLPVDRIDGEINDGLKGLAEVLDLDRISLISTHSDQTIRTVTHSWARGGVPPTPLGDSKDAFPWLVSRTAGREVFCVSSPDELPEEAVAEREYMFSTGAQAWLTIPLLVGGEQIGRMGTSMFRRKQIWDSRLISNFQQAADIFAGALMRKRAAEAQSESEERFRTVADAAPVMIWMSDTNKLCTFVNQGWLAFTGRTMEEQTGEGWASGLHPEDLDRCLETYSAAFDSRTNFTMEYRLRRHDGTYRWIVGNGAPRFESNGRFLGYFGSCIDITDRRLSEEALVEANREIKKLNGRLEKENVYLREEVKLQHVHSDVIGESKGIRRVLKKAEQVAGTDSTVLLLGETGTGKELIARTIHETSRRKGRIMVKVNCAVLPASLVESELFGRERGAFTGALTREIGRFELADGSTILLDEIGELPLELQAKLLRVLQEGEFERLGNPRTIKVDVRVIAATSRSLQEQVREGKFREDLFYRLNVFPITIPPLRERREDIPALTWHFLNELSQRMGRSIENIQTSTMEAFKSYYWPGNIRELRNVIERFLITTTDNVLRADLRVLENSVAKSDDQTIEAVERKHILDVLKQTNWQVRGPDGAAQILGLKPTTLESRMQRLGIVRPK